MMRSYILLFISLISLYFISAPTFMVMLGFTVIAYLGGVIIEKYKNIYILFAVISLETVPLVLMRIPCFSTFYAFGTAFALLKAISYVADIYRGKIKCDSNPFNLALYMTFLPNVFLGPVIAYDKLFEQVRKKYVFDAEVTAEGLYKVALGLFMKLVIANRLADVRMMTVSCELKGIAVLIMLLIYSVELYMDFAGGINIAIGVSLALGVRLPNNFDSPYLSTSLSQFWRRWHITMSAWFKEYVFYPLSLNRKIKKILKNVFNKSEGKKVNETLFYIALMFTWLLTGLWHGFALRFVLWGLLNGMIICLEKAFSYEKKLFGGFKKILRIALTYLTVSLLRVFDCYDRAGIAVLRLVSIFTVRYKDLLNFKELITIPMGVSVFFVFFVVLEKKIFNTFLGKCVGIVLLVVLSLTIGKYGLLYDSFNFIYGNF